MGIDRLSSTFERRSAVALGAVLGLATVAAALQAEAAAPWAGPELFSALLLGLVSIPFLIALSQRRLDLFEPTVVLAGIWLVAYVLPGISIAAGAYPLWNEWGKRALGDTRPLLASALALSAEFFGAVLIGYYLVPAPAANQTSHRRLDLGRMWGWSIAMEATAIFLFGALIQQLGGPGVLLSSLNDRVRLFSGLNYLGLPILCFFSIALLGYAESLNEGREASPRLIAFMVVAFGINTLNGTKTNLFSFLLALIIVRHYLTRPVRLATAASVVVGAAFAAVAYDLFFREYLVSGLVTSLSLQGSPLDTLREAWIQFSSNTFVHVPVLMLMVDAIPTTLPFQLGKPYGALLTMPIPRVLFPAKPPVGTEIFSRALFGDLLDQGTSVPTTLVGEFYMNFGVLGVLLGGLLVGAGLRLLYRRMLRRRREPTVTPVYALVVATLFPWSRGDTFGPTVFFLAVCAPLWLLARLSRRASPARPGAAFEGSAGSRDPI